MRNRLNEFTTFALVCFGFCAVKRGSRAYNGERKSTAVRQSTTDHDSLSDAGIRAHIGHMVFREVAALTWGISHEPNVRGDVLLFPDCRPRSKESYDALAPVVKSMRRETNNLTL